MKSRADVIAFRQIETHRIKWDIFTGGRPFCSFPDNFKTTFFIAIYRSAVCLPNLQAYRLKMKFVQGRRDSRFYCLDTDAFSKIFFFSDHYAQKGDIIVDAFFFQPDRTGFLTIGFDDKPTPMSAARQIASVEVSRGDISLVPMRINLPAPPQAGRPVMHVEMSQGNFHLINPG